MKLVIHKRKYTLSLVMIIIPILITSTNVVPLNGKTTTIDDSQPEVQIPQKSDNENPKNSFKTDIQPDLTPRGPIYIGGVQNIIDQGFPGDGSEEFPYVISGYHIESSTQPALIDIRNINVHLVIRNNFINGTGLSYHGIYVQNSEHVTIVDNILTVQETSTAFDGSAITLNSDSYNNTVANNTIYYSDHGIYIQSSYDSTLGPRDNYIFNNHIMDVKRYGIKIDSIVYGVVLQNTTIVMNFIERATYGITATSTQYNSGIGNSTIKDNIIVDSGVGIELRATGYDHQYPGINQYVSIINNTVERPSFWGMYISRHSRNLVINNSISDGEDIGLYLYSTSNNTVSNNKIFKNQKDGIKVYYTNAYDNFIVNNTIANNSLNIFYHGIYINSQAHRNTLLDNIIANNSGYGLLIETRAEPFNYVSGNDFIDNHGSIEQANARAGNVIEYNYWSEWTSPDVNGGWDCG